MAGKVGEAMTPKQEKFCQGYVETGDASKAYRMAYDIDGMKPASINRKAKELMDNGKITARIKELMAVHAERHEVTVDSLVAELDEARQLAFETGKASAAVQATMGKAKLLGLVVDKQETSLTQAPKIIVELSGE